MRTEALDAGFGIAAKPVTAAAPDQPMRILIYGINFTPELTGVGRYTGDMAAWLAEQGHAVTVVTGYPYYPHWKLQEGYPVWRWSQRWQDGVSVIRCPLWVPRIPMTGTRILHLLSFALSSAPAALLAALRLRPDVVFVVEPTSFCAPVALLAARLVGAESWLHVQDIEMGAADRLGLFASKRRGIRALARSYGRFLNAFARVTTLSGPMRAKLAEFGRPKESIGLFPNWVDTDKYRPVDASALRAEFGIADDDIVVLYAGNLGEKQGVESLLDLAALLEPNLEIRMVICGSGAARSRIEARLPQHPNVILLDPLPDDRFIELLSVADIHFLPQKHGITHFVMPSKLGPMMASGRVTVAQVEAGSELSDHLMHCAILVTPEDTKGAAEAVLALAGDRPRREEVGRRARFVAQGLARQSVLERALGATATRLARQKASSSGLCVGRC